MKFRMQACNSTSTGYRYPERMSGPTILHLNNSEGVAAIEI